MQEQATNMFENFLAAKFMLKELFDITMTDEDFIEKAYRGYRKIGNIATATHTFKGKVESLKIKLPCNVEFIDSVTTGDLVLDNVGDIVFVADTDYGPKISQYYYPDLLAANNITKINLSRTDLHPTGEFIPYKICGRNEYLEVDDHWEGETLNIIYRGQILDEDGLPALSNKEVEALVYYVAYLDVQKRLFKKEPGTVDLLNYIIPKYKRALQAAAIPEYLSQNFWDQLLSANTRMDRKQFGSSYKLIR